MRREGGNEKERKGGRESERGFWRNTKILDTNILGREDDEKRREYGVLNMVDHGVLTMKELEREEYQPNNSRQEKGNSETFSPALSASRSQDSS